MVERDEQATNAAGGDAPDPRTLTFSQAQGYEPLPQPLALEEVSYEARIRLWSTLYEYAAYNSVRGELHPPWSEIFKAAHINLLGRTLDFYIPEISIISQIYKTLIMGEKEQNYQGVPFNQLFDILQYVMRHHKCPMDFILEVSAIFKECMLAYVIDTEEPVTIIPAVTEQEGQALLSGMNQLRSAGLGGAAEHLRKAGEEITRGDWADSVRESIHAVGSVARQLDPDASRDLGPALRSLERQGWIHPALKKGFLNIYGYTSDEQGIRHPLLDSEQARVGRNEAVFMLGACASFASYLWRKHQGGP